MHTRAPLLLLALACLATACSEDLPLPPRELHPPPFAFSLYLEGSDGGVMGGADLTLVRRPEHLEHVYTLSLDETAAQHEQARKLFGHIEAQFKEAGAFVAAHVFSLRCAAVELPDCVPRWSSVEELMGPGDGPGARRLRQVLANSFEERSRQLGTKNAVVLATVNLLLTRGMMKSALGKAAGAEARAAVSTEHRVLVEPPVMSAHPRTLGAGRAAAVGAEQLTAEAGRLRLSVERSAIEARLVEAEALEAGARQTAVVADLARLRPSLERPLPGAAADEVLWRNYVSYWERRYAELTSPAGPMEGVKPPLTWPGYQVFRTRFQNAMTFQAEVSAWLRGELKLPPAARRMLREMKQPRIDTNVGLMREGRTSVSYVDDLAVDEATLKSNMPRVESVSTKQRDFNRMSRDDAAEQVRIDGEEALTKYGGVVEVRRKGHALFERRVTISRVHLVYDEALVPKDQLLRNRMRAAAKESGVELHFHHAP